MKQNDIIIINENEISKLTDSKEAEIIEIISEVYRLHNNGKSSLPHSIFLRFNDRPLDRIIGLPAYLNMAQGIAGIKWISSFPENIQRGIERASAVMLINDMTTGKVRSVLEGSVISAKRTAASAALAAKMLHGNRNETILGMIGTGRINHEIFLYLKHVFPKLSQLYLYDLSKERAFQFAEKIKSEKMNIRVVDSVDEIFAMTQLISVATTAGEPYIHPDCIINANNTILNISLRDFFPETIEQAYNIVDDIDHVCREQTSIHLTEQKLSNRAFIRGTLADVIDGHIIPREKNKATIFSPFGLGVLDLALGYYIEERAREEGLGIKVENFYS